MLRTGSNTGIRTGIRTGREPVFCGILIGFLCPRNHPESHFSWSEALQNANIPIKLYVLGADSGRFPGQFMFFPALDGQTQFSWLPG